MSCGKRGGYVAPLCSRMVSFRKPNPLIFGSSNPLPVGRGREPWVDHYLVDRISRLGDDKLQVQVGLVPGSQWYGFRCSPGSPSRCPCQGANPAREVAVSGNRVQLGEIPFPIKRNLGDAINE